MRQASYISAPQVKRGYINMSVSIYPPGHAQVKTRTHEIFPRFPQVKRVNTNKHHEQTSNTRIGQKIGCTAARIMVSRSPPHDFRQQYLQGFNTVPITLSGITNNQQKEVLADRKVDKDPDKTRLHARQTLTLAS